MIVSISVNLVLLKFKFKIKDVLGLPEPKKREQFFFINLLKNRTTKELCFHVKIMKKGLFN